MNLENNLEEWLKLDYIKPEDIPNIDLYMDQVTTFLESQLEHSKRYEEDKVFTKTMINNYSKNDLLPPSVKKKYSRNHMIMLIYIYYMKNFLSMSDIKSLLSPLSSHFQEEDEDTSFFDIYDEIFRFEQAQNHVIKDSITETLKTARKSFSETSDDQKREKLQLFSFVTLLGYDIYARKQIIEHIIDDYLLPSQDKKEDKKTKKKK